MSTHPNAILLLALTPEGLTRRTFKNILGFDFEKDETDIKINDKSYHCVIMEDSYDEGWQVSAKEGDIVLLHMVTYGYGKTVEWDKVAKQKLELEEWAKKICELHDCTYKIFITANYW